MFSSNTSQVSGAVAANYIEDVFSTWLYTGNGSTQTITNGIDLSTKGGLVWTKTRSVVRNHYLLDTDRGLKALSTNNTAAQTSYDYTGFTYNSNGFTTATGDLNDSGTLFASWTFRKQAKFFDVVTYTGNGGTQTISHNLGSVPGCIIYKCTSTSNNWIVYHRSLGEDFYLQLNLTSARTYSTTVFDITAPTSTTFTVGSLSGGANVNGQTYVAYLFAHNAGGFGLTGTDNVISCGAFDIDGTGNATVNLGYEPQFVIIKSVEASSGWGMFDNMRGMPVSGNVARLQPNSSGAELEDNDYIVRPTATGFVATATGFTAPSVNGFIYIAIRRGPMKTPTTGTSVFSPVALNGPGGTPNTLLRTTGFPVDFYFNATRNTGFAKFGVGSRLQGKNAYMFTYVSNEETWAGNIVDNFWDNNTGVSIYDTNGSWNGNLPGQTTIMEALRRAPGFCDVVCYTGTGSVSTVNHNLGVVPELMIVKARSSAIDWVVGAQSLGINSVLVVNTNGAIIPVGNYWGTSWPTSTAITYSGNGYGGNNSAGVTYVAYLFASCPGVSKVGSYTGTGALQTINCGFTGGARFVLIKRSDSTGDWYVYDSARGITSGDDPYLLLNSGAAEVTNTNYVGTTSVGFQVTAAAPADLNASGGNYIYLAIA